MRNDIQDQILDIVVTFPSYDEDESHFMGYVAMTRHDYAASSASPVCPKNKTSRDYYAFLRANGATMTYAPGCDWTLAEYRQDGTMYKAFALCIGKSNPKPFAIPMEQNKLDMINNERNNRQMVLYGHFNP